jgi:hypothetical protein
MKEKPPTRGADMAKQHTTIVELNPYRTKLLIVMGGSIYDARLAFARFIGIPKQRQDEINPESENFETAGKTFYHPGTRLLGVWIPGLPSTPSQHADIAHEATHAAAHTLHHIGFELTAMEDESGHSILNDEPLTYLTAFVVEEIHSFANRIEEKWRLKIS